MLFSTKLKRYTRATLAVLPVFLAFTSFAQNWGGFGLAVGTQGTELAIQIKPATNEAYVLRHDPGTGDGFVSKSTGAAWTQVGTGPAISGTNLGYDMTFANGGAVFVSQVVANQLTVRTFNGSIWTQAGGVIHDGSGYDPEQVNLMAGNSGDVMYVAFVINNVGNNEVHVRQFSAGAWSDFGASPIHTSSMPILGLDLKLDPSNGNPVIAFLKDDGGGNKEVMVYDYPGSWNLIASTADVEAAANHVALAVRDDGTKFVAYQETNGGAATYVKKFNGSTWDNLAGMPVTTDGVGALEIITAPSGSDMWLMYKNVSVDNKTHVMFHDGTAWPLLGGGPMEPVGANFSHQDIAIDDFGAVYAISTDVNSPLETRVGRFCMAPFISEVITNPTCVGQTGNINATYTGGKAPYTYAWSSSETSEDISPMAGTYNVTVTDANGCAMAKNGLQVVDPTALVIAPTPTNLSCHSAGDGAVNTSPGGGSAPLTFLWSNSATSQNITNLAAGTYTMTMTDNVGCTKVQSQAVGEPTAIAPNNSAVDNTCAGGSTGSATVAPTGGISPYTQVWSNSGTSATINSLAAGAYGVTITDNVGCTKAIVQNVTAPAAITPVTNAHNNVDCNGGNTGTIDISVSGGTGGYTFAWSNSAVTEDISGLTATTYTVSVTDANACQATHNQIITEPTLLTANATFVEPNCNGEANGTIDLSVAGGTPGYTYAWDGGLGTAQDPTGVAAGSYTCVVTDLNGCQVNHNVVVTEPAVLSGSASLVANPTCNGGNDGSTTLSGSGGTAPLAMNWGASAANQTTQTATALVAGTYHCTITDANSCVFVTNNVNVVDPAAITANAGVDQSSCGTANVNISGTVTVATGGTWTSSGSGTFVDANALTTMYTPSAGDVTAGTVTLTLTTTGNGSCSAVQDQMTVTLSAIPTISAGVNQTICESDPATLAGSSTNTGGVIWTAAGDGTFDNTSSPTAVYTPGTSDKAGGSVVLTITSTGTGSCTSVNSNMTITIDALPSTAVAGADFSVCNATTTNLAASSPTVGVGSWTKLTGDGDADTPASPTSSVSSMMIPGSLTMQWNVVNGVCAASVDQVMITVDEAPVANISASQTICEGSNAALSVSVTGASGVTWSSTGTGTFDNTSNPAVNYTHAAGDIGANVTMTATTTGSGSCTAVAVSNVVTIDQAPTVAAAGPDQTLCSTTIGTLAGNTAVVGTGAWNVQGGSATITTSSDPVSGLTGLAVGSATLRWSITNGVCAVSFDDVNIVVEEQANITSQPGNAAVCEGNNTGFTVIASGTTPTYMWQKSTDGGTTWSNLADGGVYAGTNSASLALNGVPLAMNTNDYRVSVTASCGASMISNAVDLAVDGLPTISMHPSNAQECDGGNVVLGFTATGAGLTYAWDYSNDGGTTWNAVVDGGVYSNSNTNNLQITGMTFAMNGYQYRGVAIGACSPNAFSNAATLTVDPIPTASANVDATVCAGDPYTLNGSVTNATGLGWITSGDGSFDNTSLAAATYTPGSTDLSNGTVTLTVITAGTGACTSVNDAMVVTYDAMPSTANAGPDQSICSTTSNLAAVAPTTGTGSWIVNTGPGSVNTPASITSGISGLTAGTTTQFAWTVSNGTCPPSVDVVDVVSNTIPTVVVNPTDVTCNGAGNGTVTAVPSAGSPYIFVWDNGATTMVVNGLSPATYNVTVTDVNGCKAMGGAGIAEPTALSLAQACVDATTVGGTDGSSTANPTGGSTPYTYAWSNGPTTNVNGGLGAGSYGITVTDNNSCTSVSSCTVNEPVCGLTLGFVGTNVSCNGLMDGSADLTVTGGTTPFTYLWSGGETTEDITNVAAANHTVSVTDGVACVQVGNVNITQPTAIVAFINGTDISCFGLTDGQGDLNVSGGGTAYTYNWDTGAITEDEIALNMGSHNVTVTDNTGCTVVSNVNINEPMQVIGTISNQTDASCSGQCNGDATAVGAGGDASYTYLWSSGSPSGNFVSNLCAGVHQVTVQDGNLCADVLNVTISEPASLAASTTITNANCGQADGSATAMVNGGTTPYTYAWDDPSMQTTATAVGLNAGIYNVIVTDGNSCVANVGATVVDNSAPTLSITAQGNASCNAGTDGDLTNAVTGGSAPITYLWSNGSTTLNATNLTAGVYTLTATDAAGCLAMLSGTITEPMPVVVTTTVSNASMPGACDGSATAIGSGGTSPYIFAWSTGSTAQTAVSVCEGPVSVTMTDNVGCIGSTSTTITAPTSIMTVTANLTPASCETGCDGTATINVAGGFAPYTYTWENGGSSTNSHNAVCFGTHNVTVTDASSAQATYLVVMARTGTLPSTMTTADATINGVCDGAASVVTTGGETPYSYNWTTGAATSTSTGVCAGTVTVTVTDNTGCFGFAVGTVSEPSQLTVAVNATDESCFEACDGSVTTTVAGGVAPYAYAWDNAGNVNEQLDVCVGTYQVTVTDANGAVAIGNGTVSGPAEIVLSASAVNANCGQADGSASATATGGAGGFSYAWNNSANTASISTVPAGTYVVSVTDASGCEVQTATVVADNDGPTVAVSVIADANCGGSDGSLEATVSGGTAPYNYNWTNGNVVATATLLPAGDHSVQVTDGNGCVGSATGTVASLGTEAPSITGHVTVGAFGFNMTSGEVMLLRNDGYGEYEQVDSTDVDVDGNYWFNEILPIGEYIVLAKPDTIVFPNAVPTYGDSASRWDSARVYVAGCDMQLIADVQVFNLDSLTGTSVLSGTLLAGATNKMNLQAGDPVPGIDISLEQIPGGIVAGNQTNDTGFYTFGRVPNGEYLIFVDVPGLKMAETYEVELTSSDSVVTDLNFFIGDTTIYIDELTEAISFEFNDVSFSIYPNPMVDQANVTYALEKESLVELTVLDVLGRPVFYSKRTKARGEHVQPLNLDRAIDDGGIFFVRLSIDGNSKTIRLVRNH